MLSDAGPLPVFSRTNQLSTGPTGSLIPKPGTCQSGVLSGILELLNKAGSGSEQVLILEMKE